MIGEALRVLVFGMLGIFLVMAIIYAVIVALSAVSGWLTRRRGSVTTVDNLEAEETAIEPEYEYSYEYEYDELPEGEYFYQDEYDEYEENAELV